MSAYHFPEHLDQTETIAKINDEIVFAKRLKMRYLMPFSFILNNKRLSKYFYGYSINLSDLNFNIPAKENKKTSYITFDYEKYCNRNENKKDLDFDEIKNKIFGKANQNKSKTNENHAQSTLSRRTRMIKRSLKQLKVSTKKISFDEVLNYKISDETRNFVEKLKNNLINKNFAQNVNNNDKIKTENNYKKTDEDFIYIYDDDDDYDGNPNLNNQKVNCQSELFDNDKKNDNESDNVDNLSETVFDDDSKFDNEDKYHDNDSDKDTPDENSNDSILTISDSDDSKDENAFNSLNKNKFGFKYVKLKPKGLSIFSNRAGSLRLLL